MSVVSILVTHEKENIGGFEIEQAVGSVTRTQGQNSHKIKRVLMKKALFHICKLSGYACICSAISLKCLYWSLRNYFHNARYSSFVKKNVPNRPHALSFNVVFTVTIFLIITYKVRKKTDFYLSRHDKNKQI